MKPSRNHRTALYLVATFCAMVGVAFASVPLYRAFCSATGTGGATRRAEVAPKVASDRIVRVHFDTNINGINWSFQPQKDHMDTRVGKTAMMYFTVTNRADHAVTGRAVFNVLPDTMGPYFRKLQCFCFSNQTLAAGESKTFPMVYFLDPEMLKNRDTRDIPDVTLSYTFYETKNDQN